ncbi:JmjC domain-containing protein [Aquabacterium sp.]|uniref:JmjC domain-containing protein n=1 Tax=Aquabacterium sp. TaxID=1872578 RepID=UPI003784262B
MNVDATLDLLGGLSPAQFMRRHWQRKPLLVRGAWAGVQPPLDRAALFALAGQEGVESRLLTRFDGAWRLRHGPFARRSIPPTTRPDWTLLVQGLDLHVPAARAMLSRFRFVPEARLDDLMISYASAGGGVGPHYDSYDVFLLQVHGRRRWRFGPLTDRSLVDGLPVKILQSFEPREDVVLAPGDMLYLPPLWGHDGQAVDECMTCSIGFRAATATELAQQLLPRLAEDLEPRAREPIYRDARQPATETPGALPASLRAYAQQVLERVLAEPQALDRALGSVLSEPKSQVWFDAGQALPAAPAALVLDRRSRMLYDAHHVFINGEAFVASGRDARLMRRLADRRSLPGSAWTQLSEGARALLDEWAQAGWLHARESEDE